MLIFTLVFIINLSHKMKLGKLIFINFLYQKFKKSYMTLQLIKNDNNLELNEIKQRNVCVKNWLQNS